MITTSLAEEFALLTYDEDGAPQLDATRLSNDLGGALLLELALAERVGIVDKQVIVHDPSPIGEPLADDALARIVADRKHRTPGHWVAQFAKDTRQKVLDRLVAREVLRREQDRVLWVFPRTSYPAVAGVEAPVETAIRQRLHAAVAGTGAVEPRTAALCALVAAVSMEREVFPDLPGDRVKARLKEIGENSWAADAVKKVSQEMEAAIAVAIITATSGATTSSS